MASDEFVDIVVGFYDQADVIVSGVPKDAIIKMTQKGSRNNSGLGSCPNYLLTIAKPGVYSGKDDIAAFDGVKCYYVKGITVAPIPTPINGTQTWLDGFK